MRWREIKKKQAYHDTGKPGTPSAVYAGFWSRVLGFVTDLFMLGLPISLLMTAIFGYESTKTATGMDVILQNEQALAHAPDPTASILQIVVSMVVYVLFWRISGQTPGKKMACTVVVDARSFQKASWLQLAIRFIAYFLSAISLVGFFIGMLRKDRRALHDLISRTAVIHEPTR